MDIRIKRPTRPKKASFAILLNKNMFEEYLSLRLRLPKKAIKILYPT